MYSVSDKFKSIFTPIVVLSLVYVALYNDAVSPFLMENVSMEILLVGNFFFSLLFFLIFFIYVFFPFLKILFNKYGTVIQRLLLTLSILSLVIIYLFFTGFDYIVLLYSLFLGVFLNFTSKIANFENNSFIISSSAINILLMIYISTFFYTVSNYLYPHWIFILLSFGFVIYSLYYSNKYINN